MNKTYKDMVKMRREFHEVAEPGWLEFETTIRIIEELKELGFELEYGKEIHSERMGLPSSKQMEKYRDNLSKERDFDVSEILEGYTGVVATLDSGKPGKTIAMRYDIDANDIEESTDSDHRPFKEGFMSNNKGAMHACGHDGHITIGLFLAKWISENIDQLAGKYKIIFQPAEEGVRGSYSLVNAGVLEGVDIFLGGHIGLGIPSNQIGIGSENFLGTTKFNIEFTGEASHSGAKPEEGKNALLGAATASLNLHTLTQFSEGMGRINVGKLTAGSGRNIVPANASLIMETRGQTENICKLLNDRVMQVVQGAADMYELEVSIEEVGKAPAYNKPQEDHLLTSFIDYIKSKDDKKYGIIERPNFGASEDVAQMMNYVENANGQAIHMMYGADIAAGHHNEKFDFDESVLENAYDIMKEIILFINN